MLVVFFGLSSCPFLHYGTLIHHTHSYFSFDLDFVLHFIELLYVDDLILYVDDLISGADSLQEVKRFYLICKESLATANFNLRKFISN